MKTKLFTLFIALAASVGALFAESGSCGDNLTWMLQDSILTISGTGKMYDYDSPLYTTRNAPWLSNYIGTIRAPFKEVIILDGVTSIGGCAFYNAQSLLSIIIPNSVTSIGEDAFYGCNSLISIAIPNSVTSIGYYAFYGCNSLPIVDNIRYADSYLVGAVDKTLSSYTIREGTKWIGESAFSECSNLTSMIIPNSIVNIGRYAFYNCSSLPVVDNIRYADSYLVEAVDKTLSSYTIREGTKWIGENAFSGCASLVSITIPSSVIYIGPRAFYQCNSLRVVSLESPFPPIMQYAVRNNNNPSVYARWYYYMFDECSSLEEINVPCGSLESYMSVDGWTTYSSKIKYASSYTIITKANNGNVSIPSNLTICDDVVITAVPDDGYHFVQWNDGNTDNPRIIELTHDTTFTAEFAVDMNGQCGDDLQWSLADSILTIVGTGNMWDRQPWVASREAIKQIVFPQGITGIGDYAFRGCTSLTSIEIPNSVTSIGNYAFAEYSGLKLLKLSANWVKGEDSYSQLYICGIVTNGGTINSYDPSYYSWTKQLESIEAPAWFFDVEEKNWSYCPKQLETIVVNNGELSDNGFAVIGRSYKTLQSLDLSAVSNTDLADEAIKNFYSITELKLPSNTEHIGYMSVAECIKLQSISIPASVTEIEDRAFENCRSLKTITFGGQAASAPGRFNAPASSASQLQRIGSWAFYNCHELQNLEIPEGVTEIGDGAFYGCTYLEELSLPASVQSIGDNTFALCAKMKKIIVNAVTPPSIQAKTFFDVKRQIPVYVPEEVVDAYKDDAYWGEFDIQGINNMPSSIDQIPNGQSQMANKIIKNGQILILRGDKTYTLQGQEVR